MGAMKALTKDELRSKILREQALRKVFHLNHRKKKEEPQTESVHFGNNPLGEKFILSKYERRSQEEIEAGF